MVKAPVFGDKFALLRHSFSAVDPKAEGAYCEFGVATGTTINYLASLTSRTWHGFDSFEGLPEDWRDGFGKGHFAQALPQVLSNVALHKGWFSDSLPAWKREHPGPVLFLHMDADLYSSTRTVFEILGDRVVPGTVIQFDEFFNYPGWRQGECKAFEEYAAQHHWTYEYIGYCENDEQVAVRITSVGP
ncbi:MAG: TylF/MycF/NovP-related O-methyltransferase [Isosphaeraceae bacterium]